MTEYSYRWIRTHIMGVPDERHVKKMEAEGWEPVPQGELPPTLPEPAPGVGGWRPARTLDHSRSPIGGLQLYRIDAERMVERAAYFAKRHAGNLRIANGETWLAHSDSRMPKFVEVETDRTWNEGRGPDRPNAPTATAAEYYGAAAIAEHPERAAELAEYQANLKARGTSIPLLQQAIDVDERRAKAQTDT